MRDKYSGEAARTFKCHGFYKKFQDAGWRNKKQKTMESQEDPGLADSILIVTTVGKFPYPTVFIEHKTAEGARRERFPFDKWNERQRNFLIACHLMDLPYYLFIVFGDVINRGDTPRVAYLISGQRFAEVESGTNKKSINYDEAQEAFKAERLIWNKGKWEIPQEHPFWADIQRSKDMPESP